MVASGQWSGHWPPSCEFSCSVGQVDIGPEGDDVECRVKLVDWSGSSRKGQKEIRPEFGANLGYFTPPANPIVPVPSSK